MKPCITCHNQPTKNGYFKAELQGFVKQKLPKDNKCYFEKDGPKINIENLKPNTTIFYFATKKRDFTKKIQMRLKAYGTLKNSGVVTTNQKGEVTIYLDCPQIYMNDDGKVYHRHFHFLYWDDNKNTWDKNLYTQKIICDVDKNFVKKYLKKAVIVDALPEDSYEKNHIENAISLPYNSSWNEKTVIEKITAHHKKYKGDKLVPIIVYCWSDQCNAAHEVCVKLNRLGFYNVVHYKNGLSEWK
jgi:rhodanese-related sulfurtransferase